MGEETSTDGIPIPEHLKRDNCRFIKLKGRTKVPLERNWQKQNNYLWDDLSFQKHIAEGNNYGVLGGYGELLVIDADREPLVGIVKKGLPQTFTTETPHGGSHFYYTCMDCKEPIRLYDEGNGEEKLNIGDVQTFGKQVVGPSCIVFDCPECGGSGRDITGDGEHIQCKKCGFEGNGVEKSYKIADDSQIAGVSRDEILEVLSDFIVKRKVETKIYDNIKFGGVTGLDLKIEGTPNSILDVIAGAENLTSRGSEYFGSHPVHGSTGGANFWVDPTDNVWHCFRHGTGGGILQWVAVQERLIRCEDCVKGALHGQLFKKIRTIAEDKYHIHVEKSARTLEELESIIAEEISCHVADSYQATCVDTEIDKYVDKDLPSRWGKLKAGKNVRFIFSVIDSSEENPVEGTNIVFSIYSKQEPWKEESKRSQIVKRLVEYDIAKNKNEGAVMIDRLFSVMAQKRHRQNEALVIYNELKTESGDFSEEIVAKAEQIIETTEIPLFYIIETAQRRHVGDPAIIALDWLAPLSVFVKWIKQLHVYTIGRSGAGKSSGARKTRWVIPRGWYKVIDSLSAKSVYYAQRAGELRDDFNILYFNEVEDSPDAWNLLNTLTDTEEDTVAHWTVVDGEFVKIEITGKRVCICNCRVELIAHLPKEY